MQQATEAAEAAPFDMPAEYYQIEARDARARRRYTTSIICESSRARRDKTTAPLRPRDVTNEYARRADKQARRC